MRTTLVYTTLLVLLSFTSAWPWPRFLPELDALIVRRQNKSDTTTAATASPTATPTATTGAKSTGSVSVTNAPSTTGSSSPHGSSSGSVTGSITGSISGSGKSGSTSAKPTTTKRTSYDPRLPAGGITMLTPAATVLTPIYKIGDYVTFGFNYTSLSATPTALNVIATCKANSQTYTVAMNQSAANPEVVWDTAVRATGVSPLLTEIYTLIIYDADGTATDAAQAGYLAPYNMVFGMYEKKPYADEGSIKCATCSGALSSLERSALSFVFGMGLATVLGFTWFVSGLDVIW